MPMGESSTVPIFYFVSWECGCSLLQTACSADWVQQVCGCQFPTWFCHFCSQIKWKACDSPHKGGFWLVHQEKNGAAGVVWGLPFLSSRKWETSVTIGESCRSTAGFYRFEPFLRNSVSVGGWFDQLFWISRSPLSTILSLLFLGGQQPIECLSDGVSDVRPVEFHSFSSSLVWERSRWAVIMW